MEIKFENQKIKKLCSSYDKAVNKLGKKNADRLYRRLGALQSANSLASVLPPFPGNFHQLIGNLAGVWACTIDGGLRLLFYPESPLPPEQVVCVIIREITDYHK